VCPGNPGYFPTILPDMPLSRPYDPFSAHVPAVRPSLTESRAEPSVDGLAAAEPPPAPAQRPKTVRRSPRRRKSPVIKP